MKLFHVTLTKDSELVVLAEDENDAEHVARNNARNAEDFAFDWDIDCCNEIESKQDWCVRDWLHEAPYSDLTKSQTEELFGDCDPTVEQIFDFLEGKEKERLEIEAAEAKQVKLEF